MSTGTRKTGEFCWINMLTPDPAEARAFFGEVLGWTYYEMPGIGHGMQVGGRNIGGLFDLNGPNTPKGARAMIGVMVKVENADATCERVRSLGGTAKAAFDIGPEGRMAVLFDPTGAEFDIWESKRMLGTDVDSRQPGAPSWFEAFTTDVDRATTFYTELFGWTSETRPMPGFDDTIFKNGGTEVAGLMPILPEMAGLRPQWATYFTVTDVEAAASTAAQWGAKIHRTPQDIPGVGRICGITSPQGVLFTVIQYLS
jgi:predicted enzyme related to lactoylglutathione lyase